MTKKINQPAIELHDITASYQGKPVLWDIDFQLPQGELIAIMGRNGAGKTTLLKCMMNMLPTDSGKVYFFRKPLHQVRKRVSYVPQRQCVDWQFPILVKDVVMMGRYPHIPFFKRPTPQDHHIVQEAIRAVGMQSLTHRQIGELSAGQQQRVFIARALAQDADIYLMDEPFAGVDTTTTQLLLRIFQQLTQKGKTIIMVHHTLHSIDQYCTYGLLLNTYLVATGPIKTLLTPHLIKKAYEDRQEILDHVRGIMAQNELPVREKN